LDGQEMKSIIDNDYTLGIQQGVRGTPALRIVNYTSGRSHTLPGAVP